MNRKRFLPLVVAVVLVGGGLMIGHAQQPASAADTARLEKIVKQNEQILENQAEIKKTLDQLRQDILQIRRRSS